MTTQFDVRRNARIIARRWTLRAMPLLALAVAGPAQATIPERYNQLVTAGDTNTLSVQNALGMSADGSAVSWTTLGAFGPVAGANAEVPYAAKKVDGTWKLEVFSPRAGALNNRASLAGVLGGYEFDQNLANIVVISGGALVPEDDDPAPGLPFGNTDVYLVDATGSATLVSHNAVGPLTNEPVGVQLQGRSTDGSTIFFKSSERLAATVPVSNTTQQLYRWKNGIVTLVGVDEHNGVLDTSYLGSDASSASPTSGNAGSLPGSEAVSPDGETFVYGGWDATGVPQVYARTAGGTVALLSADRRSSGTGGPAPSGAQFLTATPDLSLIFFTSTDVLTDGAPAGGGTYRYERSTGQLEFDRPGQFVRASDDGKTEYFVAATALASGAVSGVSNLYAARGGVVKLVATGPGLEDIAIVPGFYARGAAAYTPTDLSADAKRFAFSTATDVGFPNRGLSQVYLFDFDQGRLYCASCRPDGSTSAGSAGLKSIADYVVTTPHSLSADGSRLVFTSGDALVPQDTNLVGDPFDQSTGSNYLRVGDVYEWVNGRVSLISSGTSDYKSSVIGLSKSGDDLLFLTRSALSDEDGDGGLVDVYDARLGTGPAPAAAPARVCAGDDCQGAPSPASPAGEAASLSFAGAGNAPLAGKSTRKVAVSAKSAVSGSRAVVKVRVASAGTVAVTGRRVRDARRKAAAATQMRVSVTLTAKARRELNRHHHVRAAVTVTFKPAFGAPSSRRLSVTFRADQKAGR